MAPAVKAGYEVHYFADLSFEDANLVDVCFGKILHPFCVDRFVENAMNTV